MAAAVLGSPDTRQTIHRLASRERMVGATKYVDLIAVDDGSASLTNQSGSGFDQWVPEHEWTPGFRWLQESILKDAPYVRVMVYRPNGLDTTHLQWQPRFFLSQVESRREGAATRPVMFIAYGKRAALVRQAIQANDTRDSKSSSLRGPKSSVLVLGAALQDPRTRSVRFIENTYKHLLTSYEELPDWKPALRSALEDSSRDKLRVSQRPSQSGVRDYNRVLERLKEQLYSFFPALLVTGCQIGDVKFIDRIIREKPSVLNDARDQSNATPLMIAAENGHYEVVELLLQRRARVDDTNEAGATALHAAVSSGEEEVVGLLINNHANVDKADKEGRTPLIIASCAGQRSILTLLVYAGADINLQTPDKTTALLLAAKAGHELTVGLLAEKGASVDHPDAKGWTALMIAASKGNANIVRILLERGADFTKTNIEGKAAFSLATSESVLYVLRGAALQQICSESKLDDDDFERIKQLLAQGADINQRGRNGCSALECAIKRGNAQLQTDLKNPPLSNGPLSYKSGRYFETLKWPTSLDPRSDSEVHCEVVDFHIVDTKEKRFRPRTAPTIQGLLYRDRSCSMNDLMSNELVKGSDASFRWIHLPACNLTWVKDVMTRLALEKEIESDKVDAHDLEEMVAKLLTRDDWKRTKTSILDNTKQLPYLKPQATFVRRPPASKSLIGDNAFLFMPYLHYESHARYEEMSRCLRGEASETERSDAHIVERLIRSYTFQEYPLHPRRTLDQFYYDPLDTKKRDSDQVVYRYTKNVLKTKEPQLFMVDQLWIWIMDDGRTVLSSFPRQWKIKDEDRDNPLHDVQKTDVLSSILRKLDSPDRPEICSPYELAVLICTHCFGTFFDPSRALGEELHFIQFFERSISNVSNEESIRFQELKDFLTDINKVMTLFNKLDENPEREAQLDILDSFQGFDNNSTGLSVSSFYDLVNSQDPERAEDAARKKYEEYFFKRSYELLDISEEVNLVHEIKDIRDELSIINLVFDDQIRAVESMFDLLKSGELNNEHAIVRSRSPSVRRTAPKPAIIAEPQIDTPAARTPNTTTYNFKSFLQILKRQREAIHKMDERARRVYEDIENLLDLKQKQASVFEAHFAGRLADKQRKLLQEAELQTEKAGRQGNTVMVFTVVTVIFLPASFMAAFFALQIPQFPRNAKGDLELPLKYVSGWVVGITAICVSIISIIGFNINNLATAWEESNVVQWFRELESPVWVKRIRNAAYLTFKLPWVLITLPSDILAVRRSRRRVMEDVANENVDGDLSSNSSEPKDLEPSRTRRV